MILYSEIIVKSDYNSRTLGRVEATFPKGLSLNTKLDGDITTLLQAWSNGDKDALEKLTPVVYNELRRLARHYLNGERPDISLQTNALVNEAYLRLVDYKRMRFENRAHFFAVSAQLMRRILVDHARRRNLKRGGGVQHISLDDTAVVGPGRDEELVALDHALESLARFDLRKARVVELRFFGGLSVEETAEVLKVSQITVMRDWSTARAWLYREMSGGNPSDSSAATES
jgi:RNA polymerase sigma-70 factor (ECF subfamily)